MKLTSEDLKGQGTFGMEETKKESQEYINLKIRDASTMLEMISIGYNDIELFHVNCEVASKKSVYLIIIIVTSGM